MSTLLLDRRANGVELAGGAELFVFVRDEVGVFLDERRPRRPEIELVRFVAEELAVHARPNQTSIRVDVHLGHAEFRGRQIFVLIHSASGWVKLASGGIDSLDFAL